jgi:LPXTG-site transpeptidase (sortase) family protein
MTRRRAQAILIASLALLVLVAVQLIGTDDEPRADLVGSATPVSLPPALAEPATSVATTTTEAPEPASLPQRLQIPVLGVDAPVVPVGLESDGTMQIPGATESGWYWPGARPGASEGSAVIAAHVDYAGQRGVFFDLRQLEVGSEVSVVDDQGATLRYVVTERFQVDKDLLPIDELFRVNGSSTLTLITCGGAFDSGARSYNDNIVVRAVPV